MQSTSPKCLVHSEGLGDSRASKKWSILAHERPCLFNERFMYTSAEMDVKGSGEERGWIENYPPWGAPTSTSVCGPPWWRPLEERPGRREGPG